MILDLFSGPRGWSEGLRMLGLTDVGIEWDHAACLTAQAAGHPSIRADVAAYPTGPFVGKVEGLIASPPCQAWSMAGKRKGELDRANCYLLGTRMAAGDDSTGWTTWEDERSPLVAQPVRWVRDLRPEWVALEQVPPVVDLWRHFARIFAGWGYSTSVTVLNAADYGVPQTRQRAFLLASRVRQVAPPEPTHFPGGRDAGLFGEPLLPWVSMAQALGWGMTARPSYAATAGGTSRGGVEVFARGGRDGMLAEAAAGRWALAGAGPAAERTAGQRPRQLHEPAHTITGADTGQWVLRNRRDSDGWTTNEGERRNRGISEPAPTFTAEAHRWPWERPATTVVGSYCPDVIAAPGYRTQTSRQNAEASVRVTVAEASVRVTVAEASVRVTVAEASVLQSFRPDYPWQGSRTKQFEQIGNAVPPLLAAHVIAAVTGLPATDLAIAA